MDQLFDAWCLVGLCAGGLIGLIGGLFVGMRLYWRTGKW
jgi:hypothetical protein